MRAFFRWLGLAGWSALTCYQFDLPWFTTFCIVSTLFALALFAADQSHRNNLELLKAVTDEMDAEEDRS